MKKRFIYILLVLAVVMVVVIAGYGRKAKVNDAVSDNQIMVQATDAPEETLKPAEDSKLVTTVPPVELTEAPEQTELSVELTEAPGQTEPPVELTEAPKQTEEPIEATKAPVVTVEPIKVPVVTPAPTEAPVVTPAPTKAPTVTASPIMAPATPAPTENPTETPTVVPTPKPTPAHSHAWDDGVVTTEATCGTDGEKTYSCICGETKTESIPKTHAHDYEWGIVYEEPTCAESGLAGGVCRACGYSNVTLVPKTDNHNYEVYHQYCRNAESIYKCSVCGNTIWKVDNVACFDNDADGYCDSCSYPMN